MYLSLNPLVYVAADVPLAEGLQRGAKVGFRYIDYPAKGNLSPTAMSKTQRQDLVKIFQDNGLTSAQLLLIDTWDIASSNPQKQQQTMDYMKAGADFQRELGGRQVLLSRGIGIHEDSRTPEEGWLASLAAVKEFTQWAQGRDILVGLELDAHVYYIVNNLTKMAKMIAEVNMPNLFANIDIGHLFITREKAQAMNKVGHKILHIHLSDNDTLTDNHKCIGSGYSNFKPYLNQAIKLGIENNCRRAGEACTAALEMGEYGGVDNPDRLVRESVDYLNAAFPELAF